MISLKPYGFICLLKKGSCRNFENFCCTIQTQFHMTVKTIQTDNETEFVCLNNYLTTKGILHQTLIAGTPQQNGRVELKHRHILNVACDLHFEAHLPIKFGGECVLTTGYLINRTPSTLLKGKNSF